MRHASRRLLPVVGGLLLLGWGASFLMRPAPADGGPAVGSLAPFDSTLAAGWQPVVTLAGEALDGGRILALDARHDTVVLAHPHAITVVVDGRVARRFGSDITGAPEFIARGAGVAITSAGIALLDSPIHRLDTWSFEGERTARLSLPTAGAGVTYGNLVPSDDGALVSAYRQGETDGGWWVLRVTATGIDTLLARYALGARGGAYRIPLVTPTASGYASLDAMTAWLVPLSATGARGDSTQRPDPVRYRVSEKSRRRVRDLAATMPVDLQRALDLGEFAPAARAVTAAADGRLLVLSGDLDDAMHVEVLAPDGRDIGRLWRDADDAQFFLVRGSVYRIREVEESLVIERQSLSPPAR